MQTNPSLEHKAAILRACKRAHQIVGEYKFSVGDPNHDATVEAYLWLTSIRDNLQKELNSVPEKQEESEGDARD